MTRWTGFWYVVHYHCSDLRSLNGLHFSVLSLYPNSVQNRAWVCLNFSDDSKPKQTFKFCIPVIGQSREASWQKLTNRRFFPSVILAYSNNWLYVLDIRGHVQFIHCTRDLLYVNFCASQRFHCNVTCIQRFNICNVTCVQSYNI